MPPETTPSPAAATPPETTLPPAAATPPETTLPPPATTYPLGSPEDIRARRRYVRSGRLQ